MPARLPMQSSACSRHRRQDRFFLPKRLGSYKIDNNRVCGEAKASVRLLYNRKSSYERHLFMSIRILIALLLIPSIAVAQEESPPASSPAGSRPAPSAESTTPALSASVTPAPSARAPQLSDVLFKNLKARSTGPALMGGRVSDIAIDPRNPFVCYVALGHGGIFKTNDNGVTFQPIFDKQPMLSIGAIAVAPSSSDVLWAGTGEANDRNSSDWGDGVYRSTDGGESWQNVGLKESLTIARIVVDPKKPDTAYMAAMGNLWADGGERGLFKTTDAGKTWK